MNTLQRRRELFFSGDYGLLRQLLGMSQATFWSAVGISQAQGSRYETRGSAPEKTTKLMRLVHVEGINVPTDQAEQIKEDAA